MAQPPIQSYIRQRKPMPSGLFSSVPSDLVPDAGSPRCLNVRFRFNAVVNTPGRDQLANTGTVEPVLGMFRYPATDGTEWVLLLQSSVLRRWGGAAPATPRQWQPIFGPSFNAGDNRWSGVVAEDRFFFTYGGNIYYWPTGTMPGVDNYDLLSNAVTAGTAPQAIYLEYFANHLIAGYVTESGTVLANRIRWSDSGDFTVWDETLPSSTAGFMDLFEDSQEPITGMRALSDRLVVYKQHSVIDIVPTGISTQVFVQQVRVRGIGTSSPWTIASTGQVHFFLGNDGRVYSWNGVNLERISDPVEEEIQALFDPELVNTYFGAVSTVRGEYWLVMSENDVFVFDYIRGSWSRDSFQSLTALAEVDDSLEAYTWLTIPGTWAVQTKTWRELGAQQYTTLWAGRSDGGTFLVDESIIYDYFTQGSIIDKNVETPDFYIAEDPMQQVSLKRVMLLYDFVNDTPFSFEVSSDRGKTWTAYTVTPQDSGYSIVDLNMTSHVYRFRFRENNDIGRFRWKQFVYEWVPGGPYLPA